MHRTIARLADECRRLIDVAEDRACTGGAPDDLNTARVAVLLDAARKRLQAAARAATAAGDNADRGEAALRAKIDGIG